MDKLVTRVTRERKNDQLKKANQEQTMTVLRARLSNDILEKLNEADPNLFRLDYFLIA